MNHLPDFDSWWNYQQPAETETRFRQLLDTLTADAPTDYRSSLLTQIARTEGLQGKFTEAHHTLDEVERQLADPTSVATIRYHLERGRVFNSSQQPAKPDRTLQWPLLPPVADNKMIWR